MGKKILVALSGGVDSGLSAFLMKEQGFDVSAVYMRTWMNEEDSDIFADCPWEEDRKEAQAVAQHLGIDFNVLNLIDAYKEKVVSILVDGYQKGVTPNPDIFCNRDIKFGVLMDYALAHGFEGISTGHYCQKKINTDGSYELWEGADPNKDQSYFLALINQHQLKHAYFPVGHMQKSDVRKKALEVGLPNANRKDSQGICFLGKVPIADFLKQYIPDKPGLIVNVEGKVVGEHKGLHRFTLGQRKGLGVPSNTDFEHYVVIGKDFETNQLLVAFESKEAPGLFMQEVYVRDLHFVNQPIDGTQTLLAKPRYRDPSEEIQYEPLGDRRAKITFKNPQRALAAGQVLAIYEGKKLLAGGFYYVP